MKSANNRNEKNVEKKYVVCPTCQGTGLCEKKTFSQINNQLNNLSLIDNDFQEDNSAVKLKKSRIPQKESNISCSLKNSKEVNFQDLSSIMENFLEEEKINHSPFDALKLALQNIRNDDFEQNISGLESIVCLSKYHPVLVDPHMSVIYKKLSSLLQNTRIPIVTSAAQLAAEFFEELKYSQRPEFDELATILLQKTAHMNKTVKEYAHKALVTMVLNIPPCHCIRVLTSVRGAGHKNPEVRVTVSRLLITTVKMIGDKNLFNSPNLKDIRRMLFQTLAKFLIDGSYETRINARNLIKLLLTHSEFENSFRQEVDLKLFKKIERDFISLKYEEKNVEKN